MRKKLIANIDYLKEKKTHAIEYIITEIHIKNHMELTNTYNANVLEKVYLISSKTILILLIKILTQ